MLRRLVFLLVLLPGLALAASKAKKPDVEIWPPPAPDTDQAGQPKPKPPKPEPDAGAPAPEPSSDADSAPNLAPIPPPRADEGPPEDPCEETFDDCREDCAVAHATDDTLHVPRGKKLPVTQCLDRCVKKRRVCQEQHEAGFEGGKHASDGEE